MAMEKGVMFDTADDFNTAWTTHGGEVVGYPYGEPGFSIHDIPMAETAYGANFGNLGAIRHHPRNAGYLRQILLSLTPAERRVVVKELEDEDFKRYFFAHLAHRPDTIQRIRKSALMAVVNEMNPKAYPQMRGRWKVLRRLVHTLTNEAYQQLRRQLARVRPEDVRDIAVIALLKIEGLAGDGLGFWDTLVSSAVGAATSMYTAKLQTDAARTAAKYQAQIAAKQAETEARLAAAQAAIAARPAGAPAPGAPGAPVAPVAPGAPPGLPGWILPVSLGVLGIGAIAYFLMRR